MSDVEVSVPPTPPTSRAGGSRVGPRTAVICVSVALLLLSAGYLVGVRSPWTAHHPETVEGTAVRIASSPYEAAYFDPSGGDRIMFNLNDVVWEADGKTGSGSIPPCLREVGERTPVEVGLINVKRPSGDGSYFEVLSVMCS